MSWFFFHNIPVFSFSPVNWFSTIWPQVVVSCPSPWRSNFFPWCLCARFSIEYDFQQNICPFRMVCVKGNKAPGKKSTRNLEVVFKKGSNPVLGSSFYYQRCVCCRRFIFILLTNWLSLACPICAGQWKKGRTGKTNFCNHETFWIESHAVFFSEEVVFIKKIVVWFPH